MGIVGQNIKEQFYGGEADLKEGRGHVGGFIFNDSVSGPRCQAGYGLFLTRASIAGHI